MDDALVQKHAFFCIKSYCFVLILVLMDDALVHIKVNESVNNAVGLNPCFNG